MGKNKTIPKSPAVIPTWPLYNMGLAKNAGPRKIIRNDHLLSLPNGYVCGNQQAASGKHSILPTDDVLCYKVN